MKRKKIVKVSLLAIFTFILISFTVIYTYLSSTKPVVEGTFIVKRGILSGKMKIIRNRWGIPSITAESQNDIFWGIGYVHASDRLFQMDMIRRLATGRLSEVVGERALETDKHNKDLLVEESIERSYRELDPKVKRILDSYSAGVNYYIDNEYLPPEFKILGYRPEKWTVKDSFAVMKRMEAILASSGSELTNFKLLSILGKDKTKSLIIGDNPSTIISEDELKDIYENGFLKTAFGQELNNRYNTIGSNNWVISGSRTKSGMPILANDPHLSNIFPSYFYQLYAKWKDMELSGNTIPGIPFVFIGRNSNIAWGLTNTGTDVIDYFILKTNPKNREQYLYEGKWQNFSKMEKTIKIKGGKAVSHIIRMSVFGPVFEEGGVAMARHSLALYPSTSMEAACEMNCSKNIDQFITALKKLTIPAQNVVFADTKGNIGYFPTGKVPVRRKGNGTFPVSGEKKEDLWERFYSEDKKPYLLNPQKGFIATANNRVMPDGEIPLYSEKWYPSFRAERISELIKSKPKVSVEDNLGFQLDTFIPGAKFLIEKTGKFRFGSKGASFVMNHLKKWNFHADGGIEPFLFYRFEQNLAEEIFSDDIGSEENSYLISKYWLYKIFNYPHGDYDSEKLQQWTDISGTPKKETLKDITEISLEKTFEEFSSERKDKNLRWDKLHTLFYKHPLGSVFPLKLFLNRGPYPVSGGNDCVMITSFRRNEDFSTVHLSALRMVIDLKDFSNSRMVNSSGQSGHFMSPFYDDQIKLFIQNRYRKMENFKKSRMEITFTPEKQ